MLRRILTALVGFVVWTALWLGGNAVIRVVRPSDFNEDAISNNIVVLAIILALSVVCSIVAGYIVARTSRGVFQANRDITNWTPAEDVDTEWAQASTLPEVEYSD